MILDFHARLVPGDDRLLPTMDGAGIERAAVSAGGLIGLDRLSAQIDAGGRAEAGAANDEVYERCARSAGRLLPFYFADPFRDVAAYAQRSSLFRGLEISPAVHGFRLDHPAVAALVETAARAAHSVYMVTLARAGARPADLVRLARTFPQVTFVWGHCGHTGLDFAGLTTIAPEPNILAELSGCLTVTARAAIDRLGAARVLFGTEYPLQHPQVELAKIAVLGLTPTQRTAVLGANARRILGEENP
ncbi:amidohydrolase family protein [Actinoplanes sp. NPDC051494]|uniref:amidohydrolase family protein n=1 Tax=Actinoplanes sp. NPDC051494 TaxID=3363907 RepID=UPI0037926224